MKILVTGGAGFIGSHVVDALIAEAHEVFVIDNLSTGLMTNLNEKAKFYCEELGNFHRIEEIIKKEKPESIYHLAAQINLRKSIENPVFDAKNNILNTLFLLETARKNNLQKFIFSSTGGAIYGDTELIPTHESHPPKPLSPYGCAKLSVENYLNFYNQVYGLKFSILRYSNVYGPRQNPYGEAGVISIFLEKMSKNEIPVIYGNGSQTRDFVYVGDVARANLLALKDNKSETYNVGTGIETSVLELFLKLNKLFKNKFESKFAEKKDGEQKRSSLSYGKIREALAWKPEVFIDEGLKRCFDWYKEDIKNSSKNSI